MVSVPFRGSCSEIVQVTSEDMTAIDVSVPFRGSCSEIPRLASLDFTRLQDAVCGADCFLSLSCCDLLKKCASGLVTADAARISLTV